MVKEFYLELILLHEHIKNTSTGGSVIYIYRQSTS